MVKSNSQDSSILKLFSELKQKVDGTRDTYEESSLLDTSLGLAKAFFERQAAGGLSLIRSHDTVDDFVGIKSKSIELSLELDRAQALAAEEVRFYIDDNCVGSAKVSSDRKAFIHYSPQQSGCFSLRCTLVSKSGYEVEDDRTEKRVLLQVFDNNPVVCVDAHLLNGRKGKIDKQLDSFAKHGFDIVYLDFGEEDLVEELRDTCQERKLPEGAIIPINARIKKFEAFEVDFRQSFLGLSVSRLRAKGVPVVALLSEMKVDRHHSFPEVEVIRKSSAPSRENINQLKKEAQSFLRKRKRYLKTHENSIEWRMNEMVPASWSEGNACSVDFNNKSSRLDLFEEIDNAERQIDLQFYIFKESRFAHELGVKLARAARRGVQVRIMVDALWSGENFLGSWNSFLKRMGRSNRIHILAADPVRISDPWDAMSLRQRDHRKLIIIDKRVAFVGGRNAADEYYYDWSEVPIADWTDADHIPWLDVHLKTEGSAVKEIQALFDTIWKRNGGKKLASIRKKSATANKVSRGKSRIKLVVHEGTKDANGLASYEALIAGAEKTLFLVNDFPVLDEIAQLLIQAVHRGVKVTFITGNVLARRVDGSFFEGGYHRELFEHVVKSRLGVLAESGVKVFEFQTPALKNMAVEGDRVRPYVHAKLITADGRYASIGSANLDITASYWEREANLFVDDTTLVKNIDKQLNTMARNGIPLDTNSAEWPLLNGEKKRHSGKLSHGYGQTLI
jgi:phosphatidylserine/phosphatidylglycerophosphate/cardiolipin synthase-like enzyme